MRGEKEEKNSLAIKKSTTIEIDFAGHEELKDVLDAAARRNFRTPGAQVLCMIQNYSGNRTKKAKYRAAKGA